jgi:hypothetical protein
MEISQVVGYFQVFVKFENPRTLKNLVGSNLKEIIIIINKCSTLLVIGIFKKTYLWRLDTHFYTSNMISIFNLQHII